MENTEFFDKEQEIDIKKYLSILNRRKYILLLVLILCCPFVIIKALSGKPVYQATTKLLIQRGDVPGLITNNRISYDPEFLATQTQTIKSGEVGRHVVNLLNLNDTYNMYFPVQVPKVSISGSIRKWLSDFSLSVLKFTGIKGENTSPTETESQQISEEEINEQRIDAFSKMIAGGLMIQSGAEQGNVIYVSYVSPNPKFSADVVNTVALAYKRFLLEMRLDSTTQTIEWMKTKAETEREKLEANEKKLQEYKLKHDIYTINNQEAFFPKKISEISSRLINAQATLNELESRYKEVNRISTEEILNLSMVAKNQAVQDLRQMIIKKEQEITELSKTLGPKHPELIGAQKDLQILEDKLDSEVKNVIRALKTEYELAKQQTQGIREQLEKTKQEAAVMNEKLIQSEILNRDVEINRLLYDRLISRIKEYDVTEKSQNVDVSVIEKATIPHNPLHEGPKRKLLVGFLTSLCLGLGLIFLMEFLDNTVKTSEDAEERLGIPVIGMIPLLRAADGKIEEIVKNSPNSVVSEKYKTIRTAILLSSTDGMPKSILISGMNQGTGKTVTSVNLAITIAQSKKRVLLVDSDMRRPKIHKIFNLANTLGLSTYLSKETNISPLSCEDIPCLDIVPAGPVPSNPSELLSSGRLAEFIHITSKNYDFILFDSPPIVNVTDALLISRNVDQIIMVVRSGVSTYDSISKAYKNIKNINPEVMGQIINAVDEKKHNYAYQKYYSSYGYYKDNESGA